MVKRRRLTETMDRAYWSEREARARRADEDLRVIAEELIGIDATAAARAVQRARKSIQGAARHARRMQHEA